MESIQDEIAAERVRQDEQWGGPVHDDQHTSRDWVGFIEKFITRIRVEKRHERDSVIKIAALAVAWLESMDRTPKTEQEAKDILFKHAVHTYLDDQVRGIFTRVTDGRLSALDAWRHIVANFGRKFFDHKVEPESMPAESTAPATCSFKDIDWRAKYEELAVHMSKVKRDVDDLHDLRRENEKSIASQNETILALQQLLTIASYFMSFGSTMRNEIRKVVKGRLNPILALDYIRNNYGPQLQRAKEAD